MSVTETAIVVFTDLVGSTELSQSLSPSEADKVRRAHFATLRKAIASSHGTEVKNLGDGLMVTFSASSTAVSCAVAMQQAVETHNRGSGHALGLRVGISGGEVTRDGDDYFGDPVIEAARLCARAEGGQILASRFIRVMAGRRSTHAFAPMGELELKGLAEPLETVEVPWEPLAEESGGPTVDEIPLHRRLIHRPGPGVIGRHLHLVTVEEAYKRVASHQGREVVLIAGEAGQGKTTLAAEAARRAHAEGAIVLLGRCDEELGVPYAPFAEALNHYVSHAPEELLTAHVAAHGPELSRLSRALRSRVQGLAPPSEGADAETERYVLYAAVLGILAAACEERPVVLVLDDLQWADVASLQLLRHLVKEADPLQLLILGTYRDTELSPTHPLAETLGALRREPGVGRITLKGLDDDEVVRYLESAAGHDLSKEGLELAHAVYGETDGNPFFVSEMLRHLTESGAVYQDEAGRWVIGDLSDVILPNSVKEVVATRVARLGEQATRVLSVAAVIGRDFELSHLSRVTNRDEDELLDLLDAARAAAVVREVPELPGRYTFSHALVQHTLYQELGATRRARVHRQVGEALEDLCGDHPEARVGELAHHWFHATQLVDTQKAISYSRQAGNSALAALAPEDAVRYFNQALQLLDQLPAPDPALAVDLRLDLGIAQRQAGAPDFRDTLLDAAHRAQALGDPSRLVKAALGNNRGLFSALGVVDEERVAVLESALEMVPPGDSPDRAVLLATLCCELAHGPLDRRLALAQEATEMAQRLGDAATVIDVVNLLRLPLNPSRLEQRHLTSAKAVNLARELGEPARLFWAACTDRFTSFKCGDVERATQNLGLMKTLSERLRQPMMVWVATYHEAGQALVLGEPERAEELATRALEIGTASSQPDAFAFYGAQLMVARTQQGRLGELATLIADVVRQNPRIAAYQAIAARCQLEAGNDQEALALLERAAADRFAWIPRELPWLDAIVFYAQVAADLSARGPAEDLVALLAPYYDQIPFQGIVAQEPVSCALASLLGMLGRNEEAEVYFAHALDVCHRGKMKYSLAQTQLAWGRMLARRPEADEHGRGRAMLERSHDSAAANGYRAIEQSAAQALDALRRTR